LGPFSRPLLQGGRAESQRTLGRQAAVGQPSPIKHLVDGTDTWELFPSLKGVKLFGRMPLDRVPPPHWSGVVFGRTLTLRLTKFRLGSH
jgi:hypothetical protein